MDNKNFGINDKGNSLEAIDSQDILSARAINRPILNLFYDEKNIGYIFKLLLDKVFPNVSGIVPNAYEQFSTEGLRIFKLNNFQYLRIPTGIVINNGDYFINQPEFEIAERKFAQLLGLDLNDQYNNLRIFESEEGYYILISYNTINSINTERLPKDDSYYATAEDMFNGFTEAEKTNLVIAPDYWSEYNLFNKCINIEKITDEQYSLCYIKDKSLVETNEEVKKFKDPSDNYCLVKTASIPVEGLFEIAEITFQKNGEGDLEFAEKTNSLEPISLS